MAGVKDVDPEEALTGLVKAWLLADDEVSTAFATRDRLEAQIHRTMGELGATRRKVTFDGEGGATMRIARASGFDKGRLETLKEFMDENEWDAIHNKVPAPSFNRTKLKLLMAEGGEKGMVVKAAELPQPAYLTVKREGAS